MKYDKEFIENYKQNNPEPVYVYKYISCINKLKGVNFEETQLDTMTKQEFIKMIKQLNFDYLRTLYFFLTFIRRYSEWLYEQHYIMTENYKKITSGIRATNVIESHDEKYMTKEMLDIICGELLGYDDLITNNFYVSVLLRAIFEGLYADGWYSIINLRKSDVNADRDTVVIRFENGSTIELEITHQLAVDLIRISEIDTWYQKGRYGIISVGLIGKYPDTIFKYIERDGSTVESTIDGVNPNFFRTRIQKVTQDFIGKKYRTIYIFYSGIIHRVKMNAQIDGYTFADVLKSRLAAKYLKDELSRLHNSNKYANIRINLRSDFKYLIKPSPKSNLNIDN